MNQCNYKFLIGAKKGQTCNKNCRLSYCGSHSPESIEKGREDKRKRREDPIYLEKERVNMAERRKDPIYKTKEINYMKNYCENNNISMDELWCNIRMNN
jgi:hypothetical protein